MPINIPDALDRLCYRYPSPLVDVVTEHEPGRRLVAVKNVTVNEDYFQGHFPGAPLMPAVLMIETLSQVATILIMHGPDSGTIARTWLRGVDDAKFRKQVVPGDRLQLEVTLGVCRSAIARARALARIDGAIVAEAQLVMGLERVRRTSSRAHADIHPTAIVHPGAEIGAGNDRRSLRTIGEFVRIGKRLPDRGVGGDRRVDRDRRRQRDLSDGLGRPGAAGPEVRRRADARRHRRAQRHSRVRDDPPRHGRRRRRDENRARNLFMAYTHVAHDCQVGNDTIFGNGATLAGHVLVEDFANVGAYSGVHQFCRVGHYAFIGGYSVVTKDALPFAKTVGNRSRIYGINTIGLIRRGFSQDTIAKLRRAYRYLLHSNTSRALAQIERDPSLQCEEVSYVVDFIRSSKRGVGLRRPSRRLEEVLED